MDEYFCPNCGATLNDQPGFNPDGGTWTCTACGKLLMDDDVYDGDTYKGVAWFCDKCGALLNTQSGFSDGYGSWTCTECGHTNGTALSRLAGITGDPLIPEVLVPGFRGTVQKIRIESDNVCFGPCPEPEDEVEQHLTINNKGRVWFSGYSAGHVKVRSQSVAVDAQRTQRVLDMVGRYFMNYNPCIIMDVGSWNMTITNTDGEEFKFFGALCSDFEVDGEDLSDSIRDLTGMQDLFVFDANGKPDKIERMTVDYHKVHTFRHKPRFEDDPGQLLWDYTEKLVIDRATETIQFTRNIGTGCSVTHSCYVQEGVPDLLDRFDADELLEGAPGVPEDSGGKPRSEDRVYHHS